jgi:preprotein translocase subunit SecD
MNQRNTNWFILIVVLVALALWVDLSKEISNPFNGKLIRNVDIKLGLDLSGGLQTLLEADVPAGRVISSQDLNTTRQILQNRVNGLGVSEVNMQTAGSNRIVAEFPGINNPEQVVKALQETGLLEFVDMGTSPAPVGTVIQTDFNTSGIQIAPTATVLPPTATIEPPTATLGLPTVTIESPTNTVEPATATSAASSTGTVEPAATSTTGTATATATVEPATATPAAAATPTIEPPPAIPTAVPAVPIYHTVMTGAALDSVNVTRTSAGAYEIAFTLKPDGKKVFGDYTSTHIQKYLAIVLDKTVLSTPVIQSAITDGSGVIQGTFTVDQANNLANNLRYGSLPIPVKVVESRTVGPTLGAESVRKSVLAGAIGLGVVVLFMLLYYRLPGALADLALIVYALLSLAIFKLIPITLTLPGIAGFILSVGMAVDANVLIFERMKEELRGGKNLRQAIELGWNRAWPSIRDSNISTLITCTILYIFGNTFGASMVKGFSVNLGLGVLVSLFTAVIVTRTFLHLVLDNTKLAEHPRWFGL